MCMYLFVTERTRVQVEQIGLGGVNAAPEKATKLNQDYSPKLAQAVQTPERAHDTIVTETHNTNRPTKQ